MTNFLVKLGGLWIWVGVLAFDWWVWSNLIASGLNQLGFGILAILSFPITIFGGILGLLAIISD